MDEEHHQKNDSSIILRTTVPFIEIDSLFIDLSSCIDKPDAGNCDHFSIRYDPYPIKFNHIFFFLFLN